jgi:hypothetical protein
MERITRNAPILLLGLALATAGVATLVLASQMTFLADTWEFLINRRDPTLDTLLQPHNEHLVLIPVAITQLCLRVFGMSSAMPEYVVLTVLLLTTAALLYVYVKRRVGPWPALFAAVLILSLGPAWEVLLWPFEITFVGPVLFGLATLLALEREDRRGDLAACAFLVLSLGFSSLGIPFVVAAAVAIFQGRRGDRLGRAYVVATPLVLYAAWYLGWGHEAETHVSLHNLLASPGFVADEITFAAGSLFEFRSNPLGGPGDPLWGRVVLLVLVVAVGYRLWRKPGLSPGLWPVAAAAMTSWFLTALNDSAGRDPSASRYLYAGAIFLLMILANLLKDVRWSRRALIVAALVTLASVGTSLSVLKFGRDVLRRQSELTRADLGAIEIGRRTVDPAFQLNPDVAGTPTLIDVFAGPYLSAVDEYGSPAYSVAELAAAPEKGRRQGDVALAKALPLSTVTHPGAYDPRSAGENCVAVEGRDAASSEVQIAPGLTRIELAPGPRAAFTLRRFAVARYPVSIEGAPGNSVTILRVPRDAATQPWYLHVDARQSARVCR